MIYVHTYIYTYIFDQCLTSIKVIKNFMDSLSASSKMKRNTHGWNVSIRRYTRVGGCIPQVLVCSHQTIAASFFFQIFNYFIVVQLQLSIFSPHLSTPPQPNPPPSPASTFRLGSVHVSFIVVPENPSPHYPFPPPLWLLLDCS